MIAVDTSALAAIAFQEPEEDVFSRTISAQEAVIGSSSLVELAIVLSDMGQARVDGFVARLIAGAGLRPVDFSVAMYEAAAVAFRRFGKGQGHPARLNFGDCMSYAVARVHGVPLLFKGEDFSQTDIEPAWRP